MVERVDDGSSASVKYVRNTMVTSSYNQTAPLSKGYLRRQASVESVSLQRIMAEQAAFVDVAHVEAGLAIVDGHYLATLAEGSAGSAEYQ